MERYRDVRVRDRGGDGQLGPGGLSPELTRVLAAACAEIPSFELAAALTPDTARRTSEAIGAVAETEIREAMAAPAPPQPDTVDGPTVLMVGMDACKAFAGRRWWDVKVGVVAPPGPATSADEKTGRTSLILS